MLHFLGRAVGDEKELAVFYFGLILHDAVLRDADAVKSCAQGREAAGDDGPFEGLDNPQDDGAAREDWPDAAGYDEIRRAEEKGPHAAPESAPEAPIPPQ